MICIKYAFCARKRGAPVPQNALQNRPGEQDKSDGDRAVSRQKGDGGGAVPIRLAASGQPGVTPSCAMGLHLVY